MSETYISASLRTQVLSRAEGNCEYCRNQSWYSGPFSVDHIMPISKGGPTDLENLAWACMACNLAKAVHLRKVLVLFGDHLPK